MRRSDTISAFTKAFVTAQKAMTGAKKDAINPHFRTKYPTLEAAVNATRSALTGAGIATIQSMTDNGDGVETMLVHESGEWIAADVPLIVNKKDMQGLGSAITYARRYGLLAICGLAPEDDDGNAAASAAPTEADEHERLALRFALAVEKATGALRGAASLNELSEIWKRIDHKVKCNPAVVDTKDAKKAVLAANQEAPE